MDADSLRLHLAERLTSARQTVEHLQAAICLIEEAISAESAGASRMTSTVYEKSCDVQRSAKTRYQRGTPRPADIPSNVVMFARVLSSAHGDGVEGLTSSEVVAAIRETFWPGVTSYQLLPALYAAVKSGKLTKSYDGRFRLEHPERKNNKAVGPPIRRSNGLM